MPNLTSLSIPSLEILDETLTEVFPISGIFGMKPKPVIKIEKRNAATSKKLTMASCW